MKDIFDVRREKPENMPPPLEFIDAFEEKHLIYLDTVRSLINKPTIEEIKSFASKKRLASDAIHPLYHFDFFKESGDEALVEAAVRSVVTALQEIVDLIKKTKPDFLCDDEDDDIDAIIENIVSSSNTETKQQASNLYRSYLIMSLKLEEVTLTNKTVADFVKKQARFEAGVKAVAKFGLGITASYIGVRLALLDHDQRYR
jgi:hypothetical protein